MKAQKQACFHVFSPFRAHLYSPLHHNGLLGCNVLVVVNEGDGLSGVIEEGTLRVLVPGNVVNTICPVVVAGQDDTTNQVFRCHLLEPVLVL